MPVVAIVHTLYLKLARHLVAINGPGAPRELLE
jgi:hypothetical protein